MADDPARGTRAAVILRGWWTELGLPGVDDLPRQVRAQLHQVVEVVANALLNEAFGVCAQRVKNGAEPVEVLHRDHQTGGPGQGYAQTLAGTAANVDVVACRPDAELRKGLIRLCGQQRTQRELSGEAAGKLARECQCRAGVARGVVLHVAPDRPEPPAVGEHTLCLLEWWSEDTFKQTERGDVVRRQVIRQQPGKEILTSAERRITRRREPPSGITGEGLRSPFTERFDQFPFHEGNPVGVIVVLEAPCHAMSIAGVTVTGYAVIMKPELRSLMDTEEIAGIVDDLARQIRFDYEGKDLLLVGLLKGSFVFMADLVRALDMPVEVDFMAATSYVGRESTGELVVLKGLNESVHDRHVLIVEDIIDTGLTLSQIRDRLLVENPASLEIVALIDKPAKRITEVSVKYVGRAIEDLFIVGYGIDFDQKYRWLPYIGTID